MKSMKINNYKWISAGLASIAIGCYSASVVTAQDKPSNESAKEELPAEPDGHVHDENCKHDHPELKKPATVEEVRTFLNAHATYILPEFDKVIKGDDEEHVQWMIKDISRVMDEHTALKAFDPELATLFTDVLKLESDLHDSLEDKLEAGETPEAAGTAVKAQLRTLIVLRLELGKGQVAYKKWLLDKDLKELDEAGTKVSEITEKELKALIEELRLSHEEGLEK